MDTPLEEERRHLMRRIRVIRRFLAVVLWTLPAMAIQAGCLLLPGRRSKVAFARFYWAGFSRLLGVQVRVVGTPAVPQPGRPVVFVCNHSSWVDVPVVGGVLEGCFVAKGDIERWPLINVIAWLGRTVFVSRRRGAAGRERDAMRARLRIGDNLILFPEGTSSDGSRVLPFRSSFFAVAEAVDGATPLIQPVSVVYDRLGWLPTGRAWRPIFAWYGDMDLATHFLRLAQHSGLRATVLLHAPLDPARYPDRKALAQAAWRVVADGAATLRQNRPARPIGGEASEAQAAAADGAPVFA
ncbi:MAG TPA: lysophospholipid acyltransferase family protein [Acetobacteraceae bacterium]|jgi:lyso-ornithine lipid O-acyltransferase|nr:lysophospholipid acyltransferase family protein [Acetobacteraceae bacterium]